MSEPQVGLRTWRREDEAGDYMISTSNELLDHDFINQAFGTKDMYWAKPLPSDQLRVILSQSQTLGLYKIFPPTPAATSSEPSSPRTPSPTSEAPREESPDMIGLARFITDYVTTFYLTDVYVLPKHRGSGLGQWLIACCREVIDTAPALRRVVCIATPDHGKAYYAKALGLHDMHEESEMAVMMTRRGYELKH